MFSEDSFPRFRASSKQRKTSKYDTNNERVARLSREHASIIVKTDETIAQSNADFEEPVYAFSLNGYILQTRSFIRLLVRSLACFLSI